ncbi:MAG: enoyl-CoA hydratase-related protein [Pseudomonadota bacterium]|nr:enoyl-CoA hydratase-related protein [Planctomycetota bacterium]MEE2913693.1 enoyl-CoA hydratase-related protein [Pseudomonadota bacterium]
MIELTQEENVFILTMDDGENRWNTTFVRAFSNALDEVEASEGAAALVTCSSDQKFFSNGLDLEWRQSRDEGHRGGDRKVFGREFMSLAGRLITFPVPTICAINGHAFGAGLMIALSHDVRLMREDRGFACANEVEIGMVIPDPELALFRHKMSMSAFFQTVQLAKRWTGPDALAAGFVEATGTEASLLPLAKQRAQALAHLGANRSVFKTMKERIYGADAAIHGDHGPAHMLNNSHKYGH